jgi:LPS sulfotransferase NodH
LREGTTPNGVFGAKVMWGHLESVLQGTGGAPEDVLPGLRHVLVAREDKLRQAISLWRALQTQVWRSADGDVAAAGGREPVYSRAAIDALELQLAEHEAAWRRWFAERGVRPLELVYEAFAERPGEAAAAVLDHLGVPRPAGLAAEAPLRRQSDALTEEWVRRHEGEAAA